MVCLPFKRNLERLGIDVSIRLVDTAQYINRINNFDFDMIVAVNSQSLSPEMNRLNTGTHHLRMLLVAEILQE